MVKNYVYYRGGMFGDLVFSIVNNGVHLPAWTQTHLKSGNNISTKFKNFITSIPLTTLTGCSNIPLGWGLTNYELISTDPEISKWAALRFIKMYPENDIKQTLSKYYTNSLTDKIENLTNQECQKYLIKKYQTVKPIMKNQIDVKYIFNKNNFLKTLSDYFIFDNSLASLQYDFWWEREENYINMFSNP